MLLRSPQLRARHGFPLRTGGVSTGRFASLNLLYKWGDEKAAVDENRRRLAEAGGFALDRLFTAKQVHGDAVAVVAAGDDPAAIGAREADALVTDVSGIVLGVGTADCVPVLVADSRGRVAAIHAGWRGTVADVVGRAVDALERLGAQRGELQAALGPCICPRCFEVGPEVAAAFAGLPGTIEETGTKAHVDLRLANRLLLERAGLHRDAIDARPPCTMCEPDRFFSFRRDGGGIGQHLSFIVAGAA